MVILIVSMFIMSIKDVA